MQTPIPLLVDRTITAEAIVAVVGCQHCGITTQAIERRHLYGIDKDGITTASLHKVHHWICRGCFADGVKGGSHAD